MRSPALLLVCTWVIGAGSPASAMAIYSYTGNLYDTIVDNSPPGTYTGDMRVVGSITTSTPLPANLPPTDIGPTASFSFDEGRVTITEATALVSFLQVATDEFGNIDEWSLIVSIELTPGPPSTVEFAGFMSDQIQGDSASLGGLVSRDMATASTPGTWMTTIVPEPSTVGMLALGLTVLAARGQKSRSTRRSTRAAPTHEASGINR